MHLYRTFRSAVAVMSAAAIILSFTSCTPATDNVPDATHSPTPVLYGPDEVLTATHSGNLLYNSFLASDGRYIFFRSIDGKALVRSNHDGSEPLVLTSKVPSCINAVNGQLFFIEGAESGPIYKIDIDGKGETMISDDIARSVIALQNELYYISVADDKVYRIQHDGSKRTVIFPGRASRIMLEGTTLYVQPAAPDITIYGIPDLLRTDASPEIPLAIEDMHADDIGFYASSVNINDGLLYFSDDLYSQIFYQNSKGKTKMLLKASVNQPFIINAGYLYFVKISDNSRIYRLSLSNPSDVQMVVNDSVGRFVIIGNSIYYNRPNGYDLYRASVGGGQSQKIT
ncbi:MAG: DUF5050 domain-containing protein [Saccharofermentanales bacterium]